MLHQFQHSAKRDANQYDEPHKFPGDGVHKTVTDKSEIY